MDNIKTGLRQLISLKVFFVKNSLDLIILMKHIFQQGFLQREETYSLKRKSLSITTPNNFYFELSQVFASPICALIFSCLYPETNR